MPELASTQTILPNHKNEIEAAMPQYLASRRWFGSKSREIASVKLEINLELPAADTVLAKVRIDFAEGAEEVYQLPLAVRPLAQEPGERSVADVICSLSTAEGNFAVLEATTNKAFHNALLVLAGGEQYSALPSRVASAEQSNTSIIFGDRAILKLFRRLQPGENPDVEVCRFLTNEAHFSQIPAYLGEVTDKDGSTLAFLQAFVANHGDGWEWMQRELANLLANVSDASHAATFDAQRDASVSLRAASLLGKRTAELHLALATETDDEAFCAAPFTPTDLAADAMRLRKQTTTTLDALKANLCNLPPETMDAATQLIARRKTLLERADSLTTASPYRMGRRTRIHGDYHLGQVLRSDDDFLIVDFEGEPARPLAERRHKQSPLRDVAGMLRSFSYAAASARFGVGTGHDTATIQTVTADWEAAAVKGFLASYREAVAEEPELLPQAEQFQVLLDLFLMEKALYELLYELNNRPSWIRIPLDGLLSLLSEAA